MFHLFFTKKYFHKYYYIIICEKNQVLNEIFLKNTKFSYIFISDLSKSPCKIGENMIQCSCSKENQARKPFAAARRTVLNIKIKEISTEALAYLGDSVIELKVRELLVERGIGGSGELNRQSLSFVKATAQAAAMRRIIPMLSEEEEAVFKRGRNMSSGNVPKSATMSEYRTATGMEVLFGYLHLTGQRERIDLLFDAAYGSEEENEI
jgi:ribonuclease-3 family protein